MKLKGTVNGKKNEDNKKVRSSQQPHQISGAIWENLIVRTAFL
jgi:hypothetical protein